MSEERRVKWREADTEEGEYHEQGGNYEFFNIKFPAVHPDNIT